jgi:preprotein translocase SecE subunit
MADEALTSEQQRSGEARPAARQPAAAPFRIFKPGQGLHVRWLTAAGAGIIILSGGHFVYTWLRLPFGENLWARYLIPVALILLGAYLVYWLVGKRPSSVDFMIATEGEMKKVNWSTRKEVLGATKVVIFTVLALGFLLSLVDLLFILFFSWIGVLKLPVWQRLFGMGD